MNLDDMFSEFEQSKINKEQARAKEAESKESFLEESRIKIDQFFMTTLQEIYSKIKDKGYYIELSNDLSSHMPSVTLNFIPQLSSTIVNSYTPSSVKVTYSGENKFSVVREVRPLVGKPLTHASGAGKLTPSEKIATPEWVTKTIYEFIQAVLDANK